MGSPAPAALFWTKKGIETWCSSSWQSTVTARQLCKTGQYQAAHGFSRSDLTCQALCIDAVSARHFAWGMTNAAWGVSLQPRASHGLLNLDFKLSIEMHNAHPCSLYTPQLKQKQWQDHNSCLPDSAVTSSASVTSCPLLKLLSHVLFISGWTKNFVSINEFF